MNEKMYIELLEAEIARLHSILEKTKARKNRISPLARLLGLDEIDDRELNECPTMLKKETPFIGSRLGTTLRTSQDATADVLEQRP